MREFVPLQKYFVLTLFCRRATIRNSRGSKINNLFSWNEKTRLPPSIGSKNQRKFFVVQSFSTTLRVMDVRAKNNGRPHQKMRFPAAQVVGRNFLTPGHPGVRLRNVRGKSGPKRLCLCCFSSLSCDPVRLPERVFGPPARNRKKIGKLLVLASPSKISRKIGK